MASRLTVITFTQKSLNLLCSFMSVKHNNVCHSYLCLRTKSYKIMPNTIKLPPYIVNGDYDVPRRAEIKTPQEIDEMRPACSLAASILKYVGQNIKMGMSTDDIDFLVYSQCIELGAYPSPLNYKGFPKSVCTSVNEVACHGIPSHRVLNNGDIVNVDITVFYNGYHGDTSETFIVGSTDKQSKALVKAAKDCRDAGIKVCKHGAPIAAIGDIIYETATQAGFEVVPFFCGHGIGKYFHGPPDIAHVPCDMSENFKMLEGMTFTIEPILCTGSPEIVIQDDGWTVVTQDGCRSAQFEHTILITNKGCEILTV